jgi:hypothetical protein
MDDAVRHAHEHAGTRERWTFGFILMSSRLAHSVTSLPVIGDDLKFSFERVFPRGQLPTGYAVQGLYLCAPDRQPEELPSDPVSRSFIPPTVLREAFYILEPDGFWRPRGQVSSKLLQGMSKSRPPAL